MRTGIFGGSFDPVHNDHMKICEKFVEKFNLDRVFVIPANLSPFKDVTGASGLDRYNMLRAAFGDDQCPIKNKVIVDSREMDKKGKSYTFETIKAIKNENSDDELYFLIGADCLIDFDKWKNTDIITSMCNIVVAGRGGYDFGHGIEIFEEKNGFTPLTFDFDGRISSSFLRELLKLGVYDERYLNHGVIDYIRKNRLYTGDKYYDFVKNALKLSRLYHTAGVVVECEKYAEILGENVEKARLAGLLHDVAKYMNIDDYTACKKTLPSGVPQAVVHQYLGAYVAENELGIKDSDILHAINYHTTGRPEMSNLEKIVFVADLTEEGRTYEEAEILREATCEDFEKGFKLCLERLIVHLKNSGQPIFDLTLKTAVYYGVI